MNQTRTDEVFNKLSEFIDACSQVVREEKQLPIKLRRFTFRYRKWPNDLVEVDLLIK